MPQSFAQYMIMLQIGGLAGVSSCLGSFFITKRSWRKRKDSLLQQLLLSLSINDIVSSVNMLLVPFVMPRGTPGQYWALGNDTTCTINGFLLVTLYLSGTGYNCLLSLQYLFTIRYGYSEKQVKWLLELPGHVFTWIIALTFGIGGLISKGYVPIVFINICFLETCSIQDVEENQSCPAIEDWYQRLTNGLHWGYLCVIAILTIPSVVATAMVYATVRTKIKSGVAFTYQNLSHDMARERLQLVGSQAVAYTLVYVNLLFWQTLLAVIAFDDVWAYTRAEGTPGFFAIQTLGWIFIPGQGFLNCMVYTRPKYLLWRQSYPKQNFVWLYYMAIKFDAPPNGSTVGSPDNAAFRTTRQDAPPSNVIENSVGGADVSSFTGSRTTHMESSDDEEMGLWKRDRNEPEQPKRFDNDDNAVDNNNNSNRGGQPVRRKSGLGMSSIRVQSSGLSNGEIQRLRQAMQGDGNGVERADPPSTQPKDYWSSSTTQQQQPLQSPSSRQFPQPAMPKLLESQDDEDSSSSLELDDETAGVFQQAANALRDTHAGMGSSFSNNKNDHSTPLPQSPSLASPRAIGMDGTISADGAAFWRAPPVPESTEDYKSTDG